jgi:DnaK suppressor protein
MSLSPRGEANMDFGKIPAYLLTRRQRDQPWNMIVTQLELNKYRIALQAKCTELEDGNRMRSTLSIEPTADAMDQTQGAQDRDLAIGGFDRGAKMLRDVRAALGRIAAGNFGICVDCEVEISPRRLAAVPWAASCIACQEAADSGSSESLRMPEESLEEAA